MAFNARHGGGSTGLQARDFWGLLALLESPEEARKLLLEIRQAHDDAMAEIGKANAEVEAAKKIKAEQDSRDADLRAKDARLAEQEASLERREAELRQKTALQAEEHERNLTAAMQRSAELDKREAELGSWQKSLSDSRADLDAETARTKAALDAREQAIAAAEADLADRREKALAAMKALGEAAG
jgi:DNA repair exonuclease SbcCD ATPase subunit